MHQLNENFPIQKSAHLVTPFLNLQSIGRLIQADKAWRSFFDNSNFWEERLRTDFGFDQKILSHLSIPDRKKPSHFFKRIYQHRLRLELKFRRLHDFKKYILENKFKQNLLLNCCLDEPELALKNTPCEEHDSLFFLSLYAECNQISKALLQTREIKLNDLNRILVSGNQEVVIYLFDPKNNFPWVPSNETLRYIAASGNLQLLQYILNFEMESRLQPNLETLHAAAGSGNLKMMQYLLDNFDLEPDQLVFSRSALSGNIQLVLYLLKSKYKATFQINQDVLCFAAKSGNFELMEYFLSSEFGLKPDQATVVWAVKSGNLKLLQYLLNLQSDLKPNEAMLDDAAKYGSFEIVTYLLDPKNQFGLTPVTYTLTGALESGNLDLVLYLLKPEFKLSFKGMMLGHAVISGSLELVNHLLDPNNGFETNPTEDLLKDDDFCPNKGILTHVLPSHMLMQKAIEELKKDDFISARDSLEQSYLACPNPCALLLKHAFKEALNTQNFSTTAKNFLGDVLLKIQEDLSKISANKALR